MSPLRPAVNRNGTLPLSTAQLPKMESIPVPVANRRARPVLHARQASGGGTAAALRLPPLPRFHPANFPSQNSTPGITPTTGPNSPHAPLSPRAFQKQFADLYYYHTGRHSQRPTTKPTSPRLLPTGSPGPVTPLELEGGDGYLTAGISPLDATSHVDKLIRDEATRRGEVPSGRTPTSAGGR